MKKIIKIFSVVCAFSLALAACKETPVEEPVTIRLNKELITSLPVGSEQTLVATLSPEGAQVTIVWSSDNESVAAVSEEGVVTGIAPGTAVISARVDKEVATCKVTVTAVKPAKIELKPSSLELKVGTEELLEVVLTPSDAVADDLEWSTSDADVATVKDGLVKAVSKGYATITVKCNGGELPAVCKVTVTEENTAPTPDPVLVTEIQMQSELNMEVGDEALLTTVVLPENADDKTVRFSVEGDCVRIDENTGKVTALKEGTAKVTASAQDQSGVDALCTVTVKEPEDDVVKVQSVVIVAENGATEAQVGVPLQLEAVFNPSDAVVNNVSWTVDNQEYAEVDQNGLLTAKFAERGSDNEWKGVVISVNADGKTASIVMKLIPRQADAIVFDMPGRTLKVGEPWTVNARITPEDAGLPYTTFHTGGLLIRDGVFMSDTPGHFDIYFAISDHADLVYERRATFSVDVDPYWVETVSVDASLALEVGSSTTLIPEFTSDVAGVEPSFRNVTWHSSDESVVKVDEMGNVSAVGSGTADVTVTTASEWSVPSGNAQKSATCKVTVTESANPVYVGDYFYSDGTWSTDLQSGKTVVGIVFSTANATSTDPQLKKDHAGCTHGLVVSVKEYDSPIAMVYGTDYSWNSVNNYAVEQGGYADMTSETVICGYSNTSAMKAFKSAKGDYSKYLDIIEGHQVSVKGASSWYMPSQYELSLIGANYDLINGRLSGVGDQFEGFVNSWDSSLRSGVYWSSTYLSGLGSQSKPYILSSNMLDTSMKMHSYSYQVRLVFAF